MKVTIGDYPENSDTKREVSIVIERFDTWSMDHTLAMIILPMLKQLKESKHGAPYVDDADVPIGMRSLDAPAVDPDTGDVDDNHFRRWNHVMDEMIWAFEQILADDYTEQFFSGVSHKLWQPLDKDKNVLGDAIELDDKKYDDLEGVEFWKMVKADDDNFEIDREGLTKWENRIKNGTRLFGVYYQGLWD
jgi:hypothetical protein